MEIPVASELFIGSTVGGGCKKVRPHDVLLDQRDRGETEVSIQSDGAEMFGNSAAPTGRILYILLIAVGVGGAAQ